VFPMSSFLFPMSSFEMETQMSSKMSSTIF
jgi:hypothetical protein